MAGVADQTEFQLAARLDARDMSQFAVRVDVAGFLGIEKLAIPGCAAGKISRGERDARPAEGRVGVGVAPPPRVAGK
jgi:hypothetical protein